VRWLEVRPRGWLQPSHTPAISSPAAENMSSYSTGFASDLLGGLRGHISIPGVLSALLIVFLVSKALKYPQGLKVCHYYPTIQSTPDRHTIASLKAVSHIPGFRVLFHPFSLPGLLLPTTWWNPGLYFVWNWRHTCEYTAFNFCGAHSTTIWTVYRRYGNDTISLVPLFAGPPAFYTSNIDVTRQVASSSGGRSFAKPDSINRTLLYVLPSSLIPIFLIIEILNYEPASGE
jgi:hypothetical protein